MDLKIIKKLVSGLPITGDTLLSIQGGCAVYQSGGKIKVEASSRLKIGDTVTGVYHGHTEKDGQTLLIVNVDHLNSQSINHECYQEYIRIKRDYKLSDLLTED